MRGTHWILAVLCAAVLVPSRLVLEAEPEPVPGVGELAAHSPASERTADESWAPPDAPPDRSGGSPDAPPDRSDGSPDEPSAEPGPRSP